MRKKLFVNNFSIHPSRTTLLILHGTFIAVILLGILLLSYDGIARSSWLGSRTWVLVAIVAYLLCAELLIRKNLQNVVNLMLVTFYIFLAFCTLLLWGLNAPVGILTISFAVILPSILMGARSIFPVTIISIIALISVQQLHSNKIVLSNIQHLTLESTLWDVATYATILSIFALVSWLAINQREKSLNRALLAESELKLQKDSLAVELEKQSVALRLAQLDQVRHLHKFALLGQSSAATLHELSNHLSILNFDIEDLRQQHSNSKAIANAKNSIDYINKMVRQARQQLNLHDDYESFNAIRVVNRSMKDLNAKFKYHHIKFSKRTTEGKNSFTTTGSPSALMQIVVILLNNALDATQNTDKAEVILEVKNSKSKLHISVIDNGPGVSPTLHSSLFKPVTSTKTTGLGVGLYIAQHLAKDQFDGNIVLSPTKTGACFTLTIPAKKSSSRHLNNEPAISHTPQQPHAPRSTASP